MQYFNIKQSLHRRVLQRLKRSIVAIRGLAALNRTKTAARNITAILITAMTLGATVASFGQDKKTPPPEAEAFKVIVHIDNPIEELTRKDVDRLFVRRYKSWDRLGFDAVAEVVNLPTKNPTREAFSRAIHQKKVTAIEAFWQKMLFSGRDAPPPTRDSDELVIQFVGGAPGRIGYISSETEIDSEKDKVKVLNVTY